MTAAGTLTTMDGAGRFQLESAEISGVTVPKSLLQELLSYYSTDAGDARRHRHGRAVRTARSHPEIRVGVGSATVVQ